MALTAAPTSGYTFSHWSGDASGTSNPTTLTISANRYVTANFTYTPPQCTLSTSVAPAGGGTTSGGGTYTCGSQVTVTATANPNYTFANWTWNGAVQSTSPSYTFALTSSRTLVANFTYTPPPCTLTLTSPNGGERLQTGSSVNIQWSGQTRSGQGIDLALLGWDGRSWVVDRMIDLSDPNDGSYSWAIPSDVTPGGYKIRLRDLGDGTCYDDSDGNFWIGPPCTLQLTAPSGGDTIVRGTTLRVTWTGTTPSTNVLVNLYRPESGWQWLGVANASAKQFEWQVPTNGLDWSRDYKIRLFDNTDASCEAIAQPLTIHDSAGEPVFDSSGPPTQVNGCGDGDGIIEPGERWRVPVTIRNEGDGPAVDVVCSLTLARDIPGVFLVTPKLSFGDIPSGMTATVDAELALVSTAAPCGTEIAVSLAAIGWDGALALTTSVEVLRETIGGAGTPLCDSASGCVDAAPFSMGVPLGEGDYWTYDVSSPDPTVPSIVTDTVLPGNTQVNGVPTVAVESSPAGVRDFFTTDAQGLQYHQYFDPAFHVGGGEVAQWTEVYDPPIQLIAPYQHVGQSITSRGMVTFSTDYAPIFDKFPYVVVATPEVKESVTIAGQTFEATRVSWTTTATNPYECRGDWTETRTVWFVPDIGRVKIHDAGQDLCDLDLWDITAQLTDSNLLPPPCSEIWYQDGDGDGYGNPAASVTACDAPTGYVADSTDCDDTKDTVYPGAPELCDGIDNDCDGTVDEGVGSTWYRDADGDGYGNPAASVTACDAPTGYVADNSDCDDTQATVYPGAPELCDGIDNDCDGNAEQAPAAPGGLRVGGLHPARVTVCWDAVAGAVEYAVFRSTTETRPIEPIDTVLAPTTCYPDYPPELGTEYRYWVQSRSACGDGGVGGPVIGRTCIPFTVDSIAASDGTPLDRVEVTWAGSGVQGCYIYRSETSTFDPASQIATVDSPATSYDDFSAEPGVPYYYWVRPWGECDMGGPVGPDIGWRDNVAPVANAGPDQIGVECTGGGSAPVSLDGTVSSDPNGLSDIASYEWKEGATLLGSGATLTVPLGLGIHTITLTVTDAGGLSDTDMVTAEVVDTVPPHIVAPHRVGTLDTGDDVRSVVVDGRLAYAVAQQSAGVALHVADLSDPAAPVLVGTTVVVPGGTVRRHALAVDGRYAYVAANDPADPVSPGFLYVLDVTDPALPTVVGTLQLPLADSPLPNSPVYAGPVIVAGGFVYAVGQGTADYLLIVDASDPTAPAVIGRATPSTAYEFDPEALSVEGHYAYVAAGHNMLVVYNIADPAAPAEVGAWYDWPAGGPGEPWTTGVALVGSQAYVVDEKGRLFVVDLTNPAAPATVSVTSLPWSRPGDVAVTWPYAYVSHGDGLGILEVRDPAAPVVLGSAAAPGTGPVWSDPPGSGPVSPDLMVQGGYAFIAAGEAGMHVVQTSTAAARADGLVGRLTVAGSVRSVAVDGPLAYAVVEDAAGVTLLVVDVRDPATPLIVSTTPLLIGGRAPAHGLAVRDGYAYVAANDLGDPVRARLLVVVVADPAAPTVAATLALPHGAIPASELDPVIAGPMAVSGGYAHVILSAGVNGMAVDLAVVDVRDPETPVLRGQTAIAVMGPFVSDLAVHGQYAYTANEDYGVRMADVSDPAAPVAAGGWDTNYDYGGPEAWFYGVAAAGDQFYALDHNGRFFVTAAGSSPILGYSTGVGGALALDVLWPFAYLMWPNGIGLVDMRDSTAPLTLAGRSPLLTAPQAWFLPDLAIQGRYGYAAMGAAGLQIVDLQGPVAPADLVIECSGASGTTVDLGPVWAADGCGTVTLTNDAPPVFPVGATVVTWTATDAAGNETVATQTVTVIDPSAPTAPASVSAPAEDCDGTFTVSWSDAGAPRYELREATQSDFSDAVEAYSGPDLSVELAGRAPGQGAYRGGTYYYQARARSTCGTYSPWTPTAPGILVSVDCCALQVTAPNGGEAYSPGETLTITWTGAKSDLQMEILDCTSGTCVPSGIEGLSVLNDGTYPWLIPGDIAPGHYKVRLTELSDPTCTDTSDAPFAIGRFITWVTLPPVNAQGGDDSIFLSWELVNFSGPITENQAHFGIKSVLGSSPVQPGTNGVHSQTLRAPNIGTWGAPKTFTYIIRALDNGAQVLSSPAQTLVSPGSHPPTVTWVTPPPASVPSGGQFTVEWQLSNYVAPSSTNQVGWGVTSIVGSQCNQPGPDGVYSCTVNVPVVGAAGTLYYTAYAENSIEFAFAPVMPVQITLP